MWVILAFLGGSLFGTLVMAILLAGGSTRKNILG